MERGTLAFLCVFDYCQLCCFIFPGVSLFQCFSSRLLIWTFSLSCFLHTLTHTTYRNLNLQFSLRSFSPISPFHFLTTFLCVTFVCAKVETPIPILLPFFCYLFCSFCWSHLNLLLVFFSHFFTCPQCCKPLALLTLCVLFCIIVQIFDSFLLSFLFFLRSKLLCVAFLKRTSQL